MSDLIQSQPDLFESIRPEVLRNDVIASLRKRDEQASSAAIKALEKKYCDDETLPAFYVLHKALCCPIDMRDGAMVVEVMKWIEQEVSPSARKILPEKAASAALLAPLLNDAKLAISQLPNIDIGPLRYELHRLEMQIIPIKPAVTRDPGPPDTGTGPPIYDQTKQGDRGLCAVCRKVGCTCK